MPEEAPALRPPSASQLIQLSQDQRLRKPSSRNNQRLPTLNRSHPKALAPRPAPTQRVEKRSPSLAQEKAKRQLQRSTKQSESPQSQKPINNNLKHSSQSPESGLRNQWLPRINTNTYSMIAMTISNFKTSSIHWMTQTWVSKQALSANHPLFNSRNSTWTLKGAQSRAYSAWTRMTFRSAETRHMCLTKPSSCSTNNFSKSSDNSTKLKAQQARSQPLLTPPRRKPPMQSPTRASPTLRTLKPRRKRMPSRRTSHSTSL